MYKPVLYIDMDDTMCDFSRAAYQDIVAVPKIQYPQATFDFFRKLDPIPGSIEAFHKLEERFFVMILSKPSENNLLCYTDKAVWIRDHLGQEYVNRLMLSCHKQLAKGAYLIDDFAPEWRQEMVETGEVFDGEVLHFGSARFPDWEAILEYLMPGYYEIKEIKPPEYHKDCEVNISFFMIDRESGMYWENMEIREDGKLYDCDEEVDWSLIINNSNLDFEQLIYVCENGETEASVIFKDGTEIYHVEEVLQRLIKGKTISIERGISFIDNSAVCRAFQTAFHVSLEREWKYFYVAIDIHGTMIKPDYETQAPTEFYPGVKKMLQEMSRRKDMKLIMYTCSHDNEIEKYKKFFRENGINFDMINENDDVKDTKYGNFKNKPYMNVLLEDKAGFNPNRDWARVKKVLSLYPENYLS